MSSTHSLLTRLSCLPFPSSTSIVHGCACLVVGYGEDNPLSLILFDENYVAYKPIILSSFIYIHSNELLFIIILV